MMKGIGQRLAVPGILSEVAAEAAEAAEEQAGEVQGDSNTASRGPIKESEAEAHSN